MEAHHVSPKIGVRARQILHRRFRPQGRDGRAGRPEASRGLPDDVLVRPGRGTAGARAGRRPARADRPDLAGISQDEPALPLDDPRRRSRDLRRSAAWSWPGSPGAGPARPSPCVIGRAPACSRSGPCSPSSACTRSSAVILSSAFAYKAAALAEGSVRPVPDRRSQDLAGHGGGPRDFRRVHRLLGDDLGTASLEPAAREPPGRAQRAVHRPGQRPGRQHEPLRLRASDHAATWPIWPGTGSASTRRDRRPPGRSPRTRACSPASGRTGSPSTG